MRKELPVERQNDHSSERWKGDYNFITFFFVFAAEIFVLTLIPERFKQYNHVRNRQIAGKANINVTATTSTRDLPQNNADVATLSSTLIFFILS